MPPAGDLIFKHISLKGHFTFRPQHMGSIWVDIIKKKPSLGTLKKKTKNLSTHMKPRQMEERASQVLKCSMQTMAEMTAVSQEYGVEMG